MRVNYGRKEESPLGSSKNGVTDWAGSSDKAGITAGPKGLSEAGNIPTFDAGPMPIFDSMLPQDASGVKGLWQ